jgi:catalase
MPESAHMVMWTMSDRALPRSYRMMEGFGVHTFRLVNAQGVSRFVKFHWKPLLGTHALVWDEAQKLAGKDPDYHRRDLWEAIENGDFPEYELGVQIIEEADADKLGIELLDPTKIVPEELVPVRRIGKLTLNRNPTNFFAETEQVAFCVANLVPGIEVTNDPLMQARLFSYLDTQLSRLGGPNFAEIPINRPIVPVRNHQQDGFKRHTINVGRVNYHPNSLGGGCPMLSSAREGGYVHFPEKAGGEKARVRSESFSDHFSQAGLFFRSMTPIEQAHIIKALLFELGKVETKEIRQRVVEQLLAKIDERLATTVAAGLGLPPPKVAVVKGTIDTSPALSMENTKKDSIKTRRIGVLVAEGVDVGEVQTVRKALEKAGAQVKVIAKHLGTVKGEGGKSVEVDRSSLTTDSIEYDAIFIPGGSASVAVLKKDGEALHFVQEAYRHCKAIGATKEGMELLRACGLDVEAPGVVTSEATGMSSFPEAFIAAIAQHRHWSRADRVSVPA